MPFWGCRLALAVLLVQCSWSGGQWLDKEGEEVALPQGLAKVRELRDKVRRDGGNDRGGYGQISSPHSSSSRPPASDGNYTEIVSAWNFFKAPDPGRAVVARGQGREAKGRERGLWDEEWQHVRPSSQGTRAGGAGVEPSEAMGTVGEVVAKGLSSMHSAGLDQVAEQLWGHGAGGGRLEAAQRRSKEYGCLLTQLSSVLKLMADKAHAQRDVDMRRRGEMLQECTARRRDGAEAIKVLQEEIARDEHSLRTWQRIKRSVGNDNSLQQQQQQPQQQRSAVVGQTGNGRGKGHSSSSSSRQESDSLPSSSSGGSGVSLSEAQQGRAEAMERKLQASIREKRREEQRLDMSIKLAALKCTSLKVREMSEGKESNRRRVMFRRSSEQLEKLAKEAEQGLADEVLEALGDIPDGRLPACGDATVALDIGDETFVNNWIVLGLFDVLGALHERSEAHYASLHEAGSQCADLMTRTGATLERVREGEDAVELILGRVREQRRIVEVLLEHQLSLESGASVIKEGLERLRGSLELLSSEQAEGYMPVLEQMQHQLVDAEDAVARHRRGMEGPMSELKRLEREGEKLQNSEAQARHEAGGEAHNAGQCVANSRATRERAGAVAEHLAKLGYAVDYARDVWVEARTTGVEES